MKVLVRQARGTDAPAICALLRTVTPLILPDSITPEAASFLESFEAPAVAARLAAPNYIHLIAESGRDLRGYISLRDGQHLYHLFVQPEFHGQGIGRLLWQHLLQVARPGALTVNSSLLAVPVYRSFGFVPSGEPQLHCCPPYLPMVYAGGS
ncbi:GNAT family N-acetyltransferase [Lysobacter sp. P5_B9]